MKYTTFRNSLLSVGALCALGSAAFVVTRSTSPHPAPAKPPAQVVVPTEPPPQAAAPAPAANLPYVDYLVRTLGTSAQGDKLKDAVGVTGPKVNLYAEAGVWTRAKVDLDRDEKWDERWRFHEGGSVERETSPLDDERYDERLVFKGGAWTKP